MAPRPVQLPLSVTGPSDLARLARELADVDDHLLQLRLRKSGQEVKLPKTSQLMDRMVELNKLNLLDANDRQQLRVILQAIRKQAPILHMSFGVDPSPVFMEKLMTWLRREIHPLVLVTIGLQPTIGVGCLLRTNNRIFDFSLRQSLAGHRNLLIDKLSMPPPAAPVKETAA